MIERFTLLVFGASVGHRTRIGTEAVDTGLFGITVVEIGATNSLAARVGIAAEAGRAFANGPVKDSVTNCTAHASGRVTNWFTLSVDTGVGAWTFFIHLATDFVTSNEWVTRQSIGTSADWFAIDDATN